MNPFWLIFLRRGWFNHQAVLYQPSQVKGKDNYQTVNYDPGQPITVAVPWEKSHHTHLPQTGKSTMYQTKIGTCEGWSLLLYKLDGSKIPSTNVSWGTEMQKKINQFLVVDFVKRWRLGFFSTGLQHLYLHQIGTRWREFLWTKKGPFFLVWRGRGSTENRNRNRCYIDTI